MVSEERKNKLVEKINEREIRWGGRALDQLSFFNNLILTFAVGFIAFAYSETNLDLSAIRLFKSFTWKELIFLISILSCLISIVSGLTVAISRLCDFRITRRVIRSEKRLLTYGGAVIESEKTDSHFWLQRLIIMYKTMSGNIPDIDIEECKVYKSSKAIRDKIDAEFTLLRSINHNLAKTTWTMTNIQIVSFGLAVIAFFIGKLL